MRYPVSSALWYTFGTLGLLLLFATFATLLQTDFAPFSAIQWCLLGSGVCFFVAWRVTRPKYELDVETVGRKIDAVPRTEDKSPPPRSPVAPPESNKVPAPKRRLDTKDSPNEAPLVIRKGLPLVLWNVIGTTGVLLTWGSMGSFSQRGFLALPVTQQLCACIGMTLLCAWCYRFIRPSTAVTIRTRYRESLNELAARRHRDGAPKADPKAIEADRNEGRRKSRALRRGPRWLRRAMLRRGRFQLPED